MNIPFFCVAFISFLPLVWAFLGGFLILKERGKIDHKYHRIEQATLKGASARAYGAHYNANEALPIFAAAVILAHLSKVDPALMTQASLAFVAFRILHGLFYLANWDKLRALAFFGGLVCDARLFYLAIF